jgi:catechol 2,3-dioxygenase-like lactoylglutathione lyase family enzyme
LLPHGLPPRWPFSTKLPQFTGLEFMIQHVARPVAPPDIPACVAFYTLLGFAEVPVPATLAGRAIWLQHGPTQLHLLIAPDAQPEHGHIAVVLDDYDATLTSLRAAGHTVDLRREHWGSPRAYVHDPAGHLVEVMAFAPGGG